MGPNSKHLVSHSFLLCVFKELKTGGELVGENCLKRFESPKFCTLQSPAKNMCHSSSTISLPSPTMLIFRTQPGNTSLVQWPLYSGIVVRGEGSSDLCFWQKIVAKLVTQMMCLDIFFFVLSTGQPFLFPWYSSFSSFFWPSLSFYIIVGHLWLLTTGTRSP